MRMLTLLYEAAYEDGLALQLWTGQAMPQRPQTPAPGQGWAGEAAQPVPAGPEAGPLQAPRDLWLLPPGCAGS